LDKAVTLHVPELPSDWKVATQLKRESKTSFSAPSYHYFVDSPTVLANEMKQLSFKDKGTTFYMHFHGDYEGDQAVDDALVDGTRKIVQELGAIFGEDYPFEEYHFIYRLLPIRYRHAVEHTNSASFTLPSTVTANTRSIVGGVFGITAHEFFHACNVKRIRPAALWPYDYSQPQYTSLHWFTEGITDYYTNLTLVRSGLIDHENFYSRMTRVIDALDNRTASQFIAPSMQSFDSWIETSDYAHPFHNVSYYTSGGRLGLLIDRQLAKLTDGKQCMDDVFRYLYQNYYKQGKGFPENGVQKALEEISGASWEEFFNKYIHGTSPMDYKSLLTPLGLKLKQELDEETGARRLGILRYSNTGQSLSVDAINQQGDAWKAGIGKDDLIFTVNGGNAIDIDFDEICDGLEKGDKLEMQIFSGINFKNVTLQYDASFTPQASELEDVKKNQEVREQWLGSRR
jgi:predicted metalloprotease with PDZ domain